MISKLKLLTMLLATSVLLSACAGAVPWNNQNNAGIVEIEIGYKKVSDAEGNEGYQIDKANIVDGKENGAVQVKFTLPDGTIFNYAADDVKAFDGQALRADVEKALSEQLGTVAPGVVDSVISAITGTTIVPAPDGG